VGPLVSTSRENTGRDLHAAVRGRERVGRVGGLGKDFGLESQGQGGGNSGGG